MSVSDFAGPAGLIQTEVAQGQASWVLSGLGVLLLFWFIYMAWRQRRGGRWRGGMHSFQNAWRRRSDDSGPLLRRSLALSPGHSLHEVHWHGQRLLIGCSSQTLAVLRHGPMPESAPLSPDAGDVPCMRPDCD